MSFREFCHLNSLNESSKLDIQKSDVSYIYVDPNTVAEWKALDFQRKRWVPLPKEVGMEEGRP